MATTDDTARPRTIGVLLFDGVEELDAVGPWEVLAWWTQTFPDDGWRVLLLTRDGAPVTAAKGMVLTPHAAWDDVRLDVLVHPGGRGTRALAVDEQHLAWLRARREDVPLLTSVCTGALPLAAAGLLRGRPATTYRGALEELSALDATVEVRPDDRFVDDGDVITSAGVSAGIDMALHLVVRLAGTERARQTRRGIQYDPQPPV